MLYVVQVKEQPYETVVYEIGISKHLYQGSPRRWKEIALRAETKVADLGILRCSRQLGKCRQNMLKKNRRGKKWGREWKERQEKDRRKTGES